MPSYLINVRMHVCMVDQFVSCSIIVDSCRSCIEQHVKTVSTRTVK